MLSEFTPESKALNNAWLKQGLKIARAGQSLLPTNGPPKPVGNPKICGRIPDSKPVADKDLSCGPRLHSLPLRRPSLSQLFQNEMLLPRFVRECKLAMRYLRLLGALDWDSFPERDPERDWPGPQPVPRACYVAAFLIKIDQKLRYMTDLRRFLVDHPTLVWLLGFPLASSVDYSWGFDTDRSLATARHFSRVLRNLDNQALQFLLDGTATLLAQALPDDVAFGQTISLDTKHIIAWVRENNHKTFVEDRYDKTKQPAGDPDCRLGCKRKRNIKSADSQDSADASPDTPTTDPTPAQNVRVSELYWGYGTGVVTTKVPGWGEFVLAELTQPFNCSDASYFFPLMNDAERRLGFRPKYGAFDAAFDCLCAQSRTL